MVSIAFCSRFLISNDFLPRNGKTQANSLFDIMQIFGCLINTLSKYIFLQRLTKFLGYSLLRLCFKFREKYYQCSESHVYKPVTDRCPSLRPNFSEINTPSHKLTNLLIPLLSPSTSNDYTIKDSFSFASEVSSFDCAYYMTSFDIESLFTNIPSEETINICVDKLFEKKTKVNNLTKKSFRSLLELATLASFFIFD